VLESCDTGYRLANKVNYICRAAHFSQSALTLQPGDISLTLKFWQRMFREREREKTVIHANHFGAIQCSQQ
jgi:hypothetical protein